MAFHGGGGDAGRRSEGQAERMEDSAKHLGHCMVDMKELSANPEGLTAAGELNAVFSMSLNLSALPLSLFIEINSVSLL